MVSILLLVVLSASYILQNWILTVMDDVDTAGLVFGTLIVVGGFLPYLVFVVGIMFLLKRFNT